jgi:hypothetical protein
MNWRANRAEPLDGARVAAFIDEVGRLSHLVTVMRRRLRESVATPHQHSSMLCSHISSTANCHNALGPRVFRESFGAARSLSRVSPAVKAARPRGDVGRRVTHHVHDLAVQMTDARHGEVPLCAVDHLGRQQRMRRILEQALAPAASFNSAGQVAASSTKSWSDRTAQPSWPPQPTRRGSRRQCVSGYRR